MIVTVQKVSTICLQHSNSWYYIRVDNRGLLFVPKKAKKHDESLVYFESKHHVIEISQGDLNDVLKFCEQNHIDPDYYCFEFMTFDDGGSELYAEDYEENLEF